MKIITLDGKTQTWHLTGYVVDMNDTTHKSKLHLRARNLLRSIYPVDQILEEVSMPGSSLFFDFVLPRKRICIEVQGRQHYSLNAFFHKNLIKFGQTQQNDEMKREFCRLNNLLLVELPHNEDDFAWSLRLS